MAHDAVESVGELAKLGRVPARETQETLKAEAERLLKDITPGEWRPWAGIGWSKAWAEYLRIAVDDDTCWPVASDAVPMDGQPSEYIAGVRRIEDQAFIAAAPRLVRQLLDLLASQAGATRGREQEWQPIESAPQGRDLLVFRPQQPPRDRIAIRRPSDWCGPNCCPSAEPTHWMPLPAPPAVEGATKVGSDEV